MTNFEKALGFVLLHEGGHVNDPADPGGETKYGISKRAYPATNIAALTLAEAGAIYRRDYWDACRCGEMPASIALLVFDAAVNMGRRAASTQLQLALGSISQDGIIGPKTLDALKTADIRKVIAETVARRAVAYSRNPNVERYGLGWFRRLAEAHQKALED